MMYRKKPLVVEAYQFAVAAPMWGLSDRFWWAVCTCVEDDPRVLHTPHIHTLEGRMTLTDGDYLVCGTAGEFYPVQRSIFESIYVLEED